jgi:hypothetical protein
MLVFFLTIFLFYGQIVYFMAIWYILWPSGIFFPFGMFCREKSGSPGFNGARQKNAQTRGNSSQEMRFRSAIQPPILLSFYLWLCDVCVQASSFASCGIWQICTLKTTLKLSGLIKETV